MKIPYGLSNFKQVISGGYTYIDKTEYIRQLEESGSYQILLRPRRFGKSLFLSMLEHYYGIQHKADFEAIFGGLNIARDPAPLQSSYQVLVMDFSGIETSSADLVLQGFNSSIESSLHRFLRLYDYPPETLQEVKEEQSPAGKMRRFFSLVGQEKVLLLIDEYDHFANSILADDMSLFKGIIGKGGFVRGFYEAIKTATRDGSLDRFFITGVTPLMLDSLTSGFNVGENLSIHEDFNEAVGFSKAETLSLVKPLVDLCSLDEHEVMGDIKRWYNGYRFFMNGKTVYNSDMVLYFVKNFNDDKCRYPIKMLDPNIVSDYEKIMAMFHIGNRDENFKVLDELMHEGFVTSVLHEKFDLDKEFTREDFISLLFYMGFVSPTEADFLEYRYAIPNYAIQERYFRYFKVELERLNDINIANHDMHTVMKALAVQGDLQPLATEMERVLVGLSNRDNMGMSEKHIKVLLLTLMYQAPIYFIQSEPEVNHQYPDLLLIERNPIKVKHQHLIELKYSKKKNDDWDDKRSEGVEQVKGYLQLPDVKAMDRLTAWVLVTDGERIEVIKI